MARRRGGLRTPVSKLLVISWASSRSSIVLIWVSPGRRRAVAAASRSASSRVDDGSPSSAETTIMVRVVIGFSLPARCQFPAQDRPGLVTKPAGTRACGADAPDSLQAFRTSGPRSLLPAPAVRSRLAAPAGSRLAAMRYAGLAAMLEMMAWVLAPGGAGRRRKELSWQGRT